MPATVQEISSIITTDSISYIKAPITNRTPDASVSLLTVHKAVTTNAHYQRLTEEYRKVLADPAAEEKTKRIFKTQKFDFITTSGTFDYVSSKNLVKHSNLICIDIDKILGTDVLAALKKELINDSELKDSTALIFTSPSGVGVKWILHFDYTNPNSHLRVFNALSAYIFNKHGVEVDQACKDLARACFLAWDTEAFLNPNPIPISEDFINTWAPEEVSFISAEERFEGGQETPWEDFNQRGDILKVFLDEGYQVVKDGPQDDATYLIRPGHTGGSPHSLKIFKDTGHVQVFSSNCKGLEPGFHTKAQVYCKLKAKNDWKHAAKLLKADGYGKETIASQARLNIISANYFPKGVPAFWEIQTIKNGKQTVCTVNPHLFIEFLVKGLNVKAVYRSSSSKEIEYATSENKILTEIKIEEIPRLVVAYLEKYIKPYNFSMFELIYNAYFQFATPTNKSKIGELIPIVNAKMLQDTPFKSYLFYLNGYLEITSSGEEFFPYDALESYVWKKSINQREWRGRKPYDNFDYQDFLQSITGDDPNRLRMLRLSYGYLLHSWKSQANAYAIALIDEKFDYSNTKAANGGTGKSLAITALSQMRRMLTLDGKRFDPKKTFSFSALEPDHKILFFNDLVKDFKVEHIYNIITNGTSYEKKFKNEVSVDHKDTPKIAITTNHLPVDATDDSSARRLKIIEIAPHFNPTFRPTDKYNKKEFFTDWSDQEFAQFDSLMVDCLIDYLATNNDEIKQVPLIGVPQREYAATVSTAELREYLDENVKFGVRYLINDLLYGKTPIAPITGFREIYPYMSDYKSANMSRDLRAWAKVKGYKLIESRGSKGERGWIVEAPNKPNKPEKLNKTK